MAISITFPRRVLLAIAGIVLALFAIYFLPKFPWMPNPESASYKSWLTYSWVTITLVLVLLANYLLNLSFNQILNWKKFPILRFFVQMIVGTIVSLCVVNQAYFFIKDSFTEAPPSSEQIIVMNIYGAAILLPMFSFYFGFKFLRAWRKADIESERLQKENTRSQMMNLKNHLDPHFLFNNLNILSSLIEKDSKLSRDYLDKFAEVYRIILKTEYSDLTLLEDELKLIESYIYLLSIRFKDSVHFDIDISRDALEKALPPLSLQMLIENAIKHNKATEDEPLSIKIHNVGNRIIIENNRQIKKYMQAERKGTGLENIKNRYSYFSDESVLIEDNEQRFSVSLPLLEIEE